MEKIICLIISFSIICISSAQDTIVLNFQDAIDMALEKNINLKQQENLLKVTKATKLQSEAAYLPDLNISSYGNRTFGNQIKYDTDTTTTIVGQSNNMGYTIASNYTLFNGFQRLNILKQSFYLHKAQLSQIEQTKQNAIFNTTSQYLQVLLDEELIKITSENLVAQKINYERVKGFVEANITSISDLYTIEAQNNLIELQLLSNKNQLFSDKATLAATLLLKPGTQFKLVIPNWGIEKTLMENFDLVSLWELAKKNRYDLKQMEQTNKASLFSIRIAKSGIYPNIGLFYNIYNNSYTSLQQASFKKQLINNKAFQLIGINLTIPIFNRFQIRTSIFNAKVNYENNLINYENYQNIVYAQILTAYNNFITNKEQYKASVTGYLAAKLSFEKQTERFNLGIGTVIELSLASQTYVQALSVKAQAEYSLIFQKIILDYYAGTLSEDDLFYK